MAHDFKKFPELLTSQFNFYYMDSPHKQITENFEAHIIKVHDGDTVTLQTDFRNFSFPLRMANIAAKEINENGEESRDWLASQVLGKDVTVIIDKNNRVGKYGRLIGIIMESGLDINKQSILQGMSIPFGTRQHSIPTLNQIGETI